MYRLGLTILPYTDNLFARLPQYTCRLPDDCTLRTAIFLIDDSAAQCQQSPGIEPGLTMRLLHRKLDISLELANSNHDILVTIDLLSDDT